jgi:hypothetical protein
MGLLDFLDAPLRVTGAVSDATSRGGDLLGAGRHIIGRTSRIRKFARRMEDEAKDGRPPGTAKFLWRLGGLFLGGE